MIPIFDLVVLVLLHAVDRNQRYQFGRYLEANKDLQHAALRLHLDLCLSCQVRFQHAHGGKGCRHLRHQFHQPQLLQGFGSGMALLGPTALFVIHIKQAQHILVAGNLSLGDPAGRRFFIETG
jgi:hypothetical protein